MHNSKVYPVCIFAYRRQASLKKLIDSLKKNPESLKTDIYIYCDNSRNELDREDVLNVRQYCNSISGFNSVSINLAIINKGLARSVIDGVTEILNKYDAVIVLEDDLVVSEGFLSFMNEALLNCKSNSNIISICGFTKKLPKFISNRIFCSYLHNRSTSWGWATWRDRWDLVDFNYVHKVKKFEKFLMYFRTFLISPDLPFMIKDQRNLKINSWAIRFVEAQSRLKLQSLFPKTSLVENTGFDGNATNTDLKIGFDSEFSFLNKAHFESVPKKGSTFLNIYIWFYELYFGIKRVTRRNSIKNKR
ncbi:MAG: hypothetical protein ACJ0F7_03710 [Gammaproteobacteria bacterium]